MNREVGIESKYSIWGVAGAIEGDAFLVEKDDRNFSHPVGFMEIVSLGEEIGKFEGDLHGKKNCCRQHLWLACNINDRQFWALLMKQILLSEAQVNLLQFLQMAQEEDIILIHEWTLEPLMLIDYKLKLLP